MKTAKLLIATALMLVAVSANASRYGMSGCGLGSQVFGTEKGVVKQVLAGLLNVTGGQTFAITSGTSNCTEDGAVRRTKEAQLFIEVNKEAIAKDISRGNGDTVKSLSHLFKCANSKQLGAKLQKKYSSIFPSQDVAAAAVTGRIIQVIHSEKDLARSCQI